MTESSFPLNWLLDGAGTAGRSARHPVMKAQRMMRVAGLLVVALLLWSMVAPMDTVVRASGRLVPVAGAQLVQHLEGGILAALLVREGQIVAQGQEVASLSDLFAETSRDEKQGRINFLRARTARLEAEATGAAMPPAPADNQEAWQAEQKVFESRIRKLEQSSQLVLEQRAQKLAEIAENQARTKSINGELVVAREQLRMVSALSSRGGASQMEQLEAQGRIARLTSQLSEATTALPRLQAALRETETRRLELSAQFQSEARASLSEATSELDRLGQEDKVQQDRLTRTVVRSPIAGTVNRVLVQTVGGVVRPGDTLMEITPTQSELLLECSVAPDDRAELRVGLPVVVRVGAYDYSVYGSLQGTVADISPDTVADENGARLFRMKVSISADAIRAFRRTLSPGMAATADVVVGRRTVFQYVLRPLRNAADQARKDKA